MSGAPDPGHSLLVARTEIRRTWRKLTDPVRGVLMLVGGVLLLPLYGVGLGAGAFLFGRKLTTGSSGLARPIIGAALAGITALVIQRAIKQTGEPPAADGLLTTVPYRDVLAGLLVAEFGRVGATVAAPVGGLVVGFALGADSPLAGAVLLALLTALVVLGLGAGYAGGLLAKYVAGRSAFVARHRAPIGVVATTVALLGYLSLNAVPAAQRGAFRLAAATPFAWYADVVFLAVPDASPRPLSAVGAVATVAVGGPLLAVAVDRLAGRVWYMDRVEPTHEIDPGLTPLSDRVLAERVPRQTRVVARKSWRRARRSPFTVQFAAFPFFLLIFQVQIALVERAVPPSLPLLVAVALLPAVLTQHPVLAAITVGLLPVDGIATTVGGLVLTGLLLLAVGGLSGGYAARSIGTYRLE